MRNFKICLLVLLLVLLPVKVFANSFSYLDDSKYKIGLSEKSAVREAVKDTLPKSTLVYIEGAEGLMALKTEKIDALIDERAWVNAAFEEGLTGVKVLPDSLPYEIKTAAGISRASKIPDLRAKINRFLAELRNDGTLADMYKRWILDKNYTMPEITLPDNPEFTLTVGTVPFLPPYTFYLNNELTGHDIELMRRFAAWLGAGLEIREYDFNGVIAAASAGKIDIIASALQITPERAEKIDFSDVIVSSDFVILVRDENIASSYAHVKDLAGKRIGVLTGSINGDVTKSAIPDAKIMYLDTRADLVTALTSGKLDAVCISEPEAISVESETPNVTYIREYMRTFDTAFCLAKSNTLTNDLNAFINKLESDGTLANLRETWFSSDESKKLMTDYENLPDTNGVIRFAQDNASAPFAYLRDNITVGYEVEILARFCREKSYRLEIVTMDLSAMIPSLEAGRCEIAGGGVAVTPERAEKVNFTVPSYKGGIVLLVMKSHEKSHEKSLPSLRDFDGKRIALAAPTAYDLAVRKEFPNAKVVYIDNFANQITALLNGQVDAVARDEPGAILIENINPRLTHIPESFMTLDAAFFTGKSARSEKLLSELDEFLSTNEQDGTLENLQEIWFGTDESRKLMTDYETLPDINGVITCVEHGTHPPYSYVRDNRLVGYDVEILARFCKSRGYALKMYMVESNALLEAVNSGKFDLGGGGIVITQERKKLVNFSKPIYRTRGVLIISKPENEATQSTQALNSDSSHFADFTDGLAASFERTFVREDRWLLFIQGICVTLVITVLAILFGTLLGFAIYMSCRNGNIIANALANFFAWLIHGMPVVVLLMILYYIVFSKVDIHGIWVAVIAFTLTFGASVYAMILSGVKAIDKGQIEAALALGFSDMRAFFTVILPQAALHFMPAYKSSIVELVKATAVVGYIAVQDLTKMGDIVRSRTYEAFFPLIAVAVIYFVLAGGLNFFTRLLHNKLKPENRKAAEILRGIDTHDAH